MRLLLLAGTVEARTLAGHLAEMAGIEATASLAGATERPRPLPLPTRIGGFGGAGGLAAWLRRTGTDAVIDATHPFAVQISENAARACAALGIPCLHLVRPPWRPGPGEHWHLMHDLPAACRAIAPGSVVFAATGAQSVAALAPLAACTVHLRVAERPATPFPLPRGGWIAGAPAADPHSEAALFRQLGVQVLLCRNAGGPGRAKLDAARDLGLEVVMVDRPPPPLGKTVPYVATALDWLAARRPGPDGV